MNETRKHWICFSMFNIFKICMINLSLHHFSFPNYFILPPFFHISFITYFYIIRELSKVSAECRNLTESSILVLHVEVRVHCFCHLERAISSVSVSCTVCTAISKMVDLHMHAATLILVHTELLIQWVKCE